MNSLTAPPSPFQSPFDHDFSDVVASIDDSRPEPDGFWFEDSRVDPESRGPRDLLGCAVALLLMAMKSAAWVAALQGDLALCLALGALTACNRRFLPLLSLALWVAAALGVALWVPVVLGLPAVRVLGMTLDNLPGWP